MQLIPFLDLKKGSTSPQCLRDILESEFANCALGLMANLKKTRNEEERATLRQQMIMTCMTK
jgi:hypothetical protein